MANRIDGVFDFAAVKAQFKTVFALMDELAKKIDTLNKTASGFNLGGGKGANTDATKKVIDAARELENAQKRLEKAESDLGKQIAEINEKTRQQNEANRNAARAANANATSLNGLRAQLSALTRAYDNLSASERNAANDGVKLKSRIQELQVEIRKLEQETGRAQRNVGNYGNGFGKFQAQLQSIVPPQLVNGLKGFLGGIGPVGGLAAGAGFAVLGKQIFDTTLQLDSLNAALRAVSGSEEEFERNQRFLIETSDRLGLNILDLTQAYKLFYAASTQSGLSTDATRKIFNSVAESAATLKLSTQDTQGVLLAFSQILGKGKVQAEELRGQIGERVPGAFSIAARSIGKTEQELNKMLEKGEVIAKDFLPKFAAELEKTYGSSGPVEGLQASINRLSNQFTQLVSNNQSGLARFFTGIIDLAGKALGAIDKLATGFRNVYNAVVDPAALEADSVERELSRKREEYAKKDIGYLLERRNIVDQNLEADQKRLEIEEKFFQGIQRDSKNPRNNVSAETYDQAQKNVEEQRKVVENTIRLRQLLIDAIKSKLPSVDSVDPAAVKAPTQAELNKASRLRELQLKSILEANKIDLDTAAQTQKEIAENEKNSYVIRAQALTNYVDLKNQAITLQLDYEKKILAENVKQGQAVQEQLTVLEKNGAKDRTAVQKESAKISKDIFKDNTDARIKDITVQQDRVRAEYERAAQDELDQLQTQLDGRLINQEQYEFLELQIRNKYNTMALQSEIDATKQILELRKARGEDVRDLETKLFESETKLMDLGLELFKKREKGKTKTAEEEAAKRKAIEEKQRDLLMEIGNELQSFFWAAAGARFEVEKNRLEDETELINKKKADEIDAINASTLSAEDKANRIAIVNAKAQADEERIEARKRQIQIEQARFERAQAIASIILNTAASVAKVLYAPPLAALTAALGAIQLATALATPLPRYFMGRPGGKAEWAMVNDGGVDEVIEHTDGTAYVPKGRNVRAYLPEGAKVYRNIAAYQEAAERAAYRRSPSMSVNHSGHLEIKADLERQTARIESALERHKQSVKVVNTWGGLLVTQQTVSAFREYVNKNMR